MTAGLPRTSCYRTRGPAHLALLFLLLFVALKAATPEGNAGDERKAITNEDVINMVKAGLPSDVIIKVIENSPGDYKLQPEDLVTLKNAGVPDEVLRAMVAKLPAREPAAKKQPLNEPSLFPGSPEPVVRFTKVKYLAPVPAREKPQEIIGTLVLDKPGRHLRFIEKEGTTLLDIPYNALTSILYERAHGQYFLTVYYDQANGESRFAIFKLRDENYRECLATLHSQTAIKVKRALQR